MSLLDFILGKRKAVEEEAKTLSCREASAELEKLRRQALAIPGALATCGEAMAEVGELKRISNVLLAKEISKDVSGYKIALAMRSNFSARVPKVLNEITQPENNSYEETAGFQKKLERALLEITKAVSDNRYLFALLEPEMRSFAAHAKALATSNERLQQQLKEKRSLEQKISKATQALEEISRSSENIAKIKSEATQFEEEIKNLESKAAQAEQASEAYRQEAERLRSRVASAMAKSERLKARIAQRFAVLPRVLRKFGKATADSELEKLAAAYQEPAKAFALDRGSGLRKLLPALNKALGEGVIEKDRKAVLKIASEIEELFEALEEGEIEREFAEIGSLGEEISAAEQEIERKVSSIRKHEAVVDELREAKMRKKEFEERISAEEKNKEAATSLAGELLSEVFGEEIKLMR